MQEASNDFKEAPPKQLALHLRMLKHAIEQSPSELQKILAEVINLPVKTQKDLAGLLDETNLTASHYLKLLLDGIFGAERFQNEIIWKRHSAHSSAKRYGPVHDVLLFYSKGSKFIWTNPRTEYDQAYLDKYYKYDDGDGRLYWRNSLTAAGTRNGSSGQPWRSFNPSSQGAHWKFTIENLDALDDAGKIYWPPGGGWPQIKRYRDELKGVAVSDMWDDIDKINPAGNERLGYPTQKPVALLERLISASTNPGDVILDPFCGCGTALHAAQRLDRQWIGIDITHVAIQIILDRLKRYFPAEKPIVIGRPEDVEGAQELAQRDKYQFQWWATSLVKGQPRGGERKGADRGIDGEIFFKTGRVEDGRAIISVKGGTNINPGMVRDLIGTRISEDAEMALLITLAPPTDEMITAAAKDGLIGDGTARVPRTQILTIDQLFAGLQFRTPSAPLYDMATAPAQAARKRKPKAETPEEMRRSPRLKLPIMGGKARPTQPALSLDEPLLSNPQSRTSGRRRTG